MQKTVDASRNRKKPMMQRVLRDLTKNRQLYLLILVPLAIILIFKYWPMYGIQIAFRNFRITKSIAESSWVGLKYFEKFFSNPLALTYIFNTLAISFYELCLFPLSLILALMLNYITSARFKKTVQMVSYAPHFISVVVMCGLLIQFLQTRIGLINILLNAIG
ncbi:MAG: sugar ABC transporter permease, partial [Bacillota bacterium]